MDTQVMCLGCMKIKGVEDFCTRCGFSESHYVLKDHALKLRTVLNNRYEIGKTLGQGGFGITYIAWDQMLNVPMAIKEFLPTAFSKRKNDETTVIPLTEKTEKKFVYYMDKFLEEARTLAKFNNESGIVSIQDVFRENGTIYIVMYYIDGIDLNQYLKNNNNKLSFDDSIFIMSIIMTSLKKVHSSGLVHRDISPDNIYITDEKEVKLLDFGAARYTIGSSDQTLSIILKHGYAPLEQYSEKGKQGPWTDVYAVAATLYRMITGIKPVSVLDRITKIPLPSPRELGAEIPIHIDQVIMKALSIEVEDRYQSIEHFLNMLNHQIEDKTVLSSENNKTVLSLNHTVKHKKKTSNKSLFIILPLLVLVMALTSLLFKTMSDNKIDQVSVTEKSISDENVDQVLSEEVTNEIPKIESEPEETVVSEVEEIKDVVETEVVIETPQTTYNDFIVDTEQVYASSEFIEVYSGGVVYNYATNVLDNDSTTAWVENIKGSGIGEWITLKGHELSYVHSFSMINGYTKSSKLFYWNDRLKTVRLEFSNGEFEDVTLKDNVMTFQEVFLEKPVLTEYVKFTILDVYLGTKYPDCCITEIRINE